MSLHVRRKRQLNFTLYTCNRSIIDVNCLFDFQVGGTALHYAASRGHVDVARELLNHKAYVNGRTKVCINFWLGQLCLSSNRIS